MRVLPLASLWLVGAACGTDVALPGSDPPPSDTTTWYQDVAPIVATHCMSCHQDGGIAPFSLTTYDSAYIYANQMNEAIAGGVMPPFSAADGSDCTPTHGWKEDPRLTDDEKATIAAWIADDRPEGTPAQITPAAIPDLTNKTTSLTPSSYTTSGMTDQFICFILDPQTTQDSWITGWQVRPGAPTVVHHAVLSTLTADLLAAARRNGQVGTSFSCNGTGALPGSTMIGAWAPGGQPYDSGDVGMKLAAGEGIILQIHYHPAGQTATDATSIDLRLTGQQPAHEYAIKGFGNAHGAPILQPGPYDPATGPKFEIPPNVSDGMETMKFTVPQTLPTMSVMTAFPHMHFVGTKLSLWVHRAAPQAGEPADECLINVNQWNFDWQRQYAVDAPVDALPQVRPGDQVEIRCKYDNTLANPFVQRSLADQGLTSPIYVHLGETTTDEMCLALLATIDR
jgi:mono/diheme cytochrome c family protein